MKKTTLFYIVYLFVFCLLLSDGFAQQYTTKWHLPEGAKARLGRGKLNNIIFSPDSTRIAVSTSIGIWVYDAHTTEAVSLFSGIQTGEVGKYLPTVPPEALTFSDDALIVASAHANKIYVWDTATGTAFAMLDEHPDAIKAIALSPDSTKLATAGGDWVVRLWDVSTGKYINSLTEHPGAVNAIAFSPDGKILASAGSTLRLWDADTGGLIHADDKDLGSINRLTFSPDGKVLATAGGWERAVHLWDVNTGTFEKTLKGHTDEIRDIAFSADSSTLVSAGSDRTMRLWDVRTGTEQKRLPTPEDRIPELVPVILKREALKQAYLPRQRDDVYSVGFSTDATQLISVSKDGSLHVWNVETGRYRASFSLGAYSDQVNTLAFSEDGRYLASNDGFAERLRVWDVQNGTQHVILTPDQGSVLNPITELTVSSGIKKIAGRELEGTIHIWDAETAEHLSSIPTDRMMRYLPFTLSPDGKFLAGRDIIGRNKIEFWQTDPGAPLFTLEADTDFVTAYAFSPDSKLFATGGENSTTVLWDVKTGKRLAELIGSTKKSIRAFAFSADGNTLASASGNQVLLWDVNTREQINNFDAVVDVAALAFSPDGKTLASSGTAGLIQVWNLVPHPQIRTTFSGHQGAIHVLMFSPDGKTLASGSGDGTILLWDIGQ